MKSIQILLLITAALICLSSVSSAGLMLTEGQSYEFEFHNISIFTGDPNDLYVYPPGQSNMFAYADFKLGNNSFDAGESLIISLFENTSDETAIRSKSYDGVAGRAILGFGYATDAASAPWKDRQGIFRVEVTSGTIELDTFTATTVIGDQHYQQNYAVPEPGSFALILSGAGLLYLRRRRFPNQRVDHTRYNVR